MCWLTLTSIFIVAERPGSRPISDQDPFFTESWIYPIRERHSLICLSTPLKLHSCFSYWGAVEEFTRGSGVALEQERN